MSAQMIERHPLLVAFVVGVAVWGPAYAITAILGQAVNEAWTWWYVIGLPIICALGWICGRRALSRYALIGVVAIAASYVTALLCIPHTGNLLPFELIWMAVLAGIVTVVAALGKRTRGLATAQGNSKSGSVASRGDL